MVKNKKITGIVAGTLAAAILLGASFALFTDREEIETSAQAARFQIMVNDINVDANLEQVLPGDSLDLHYEVINQSSVQADIRQTLVLHATDSGSLEGNEKFVGFDTALGATDQSEFDIYLASDVSQDATGAYVPNADATPLQVKEVVDANTIKYTIASETYDVDETTDHDYVIIFKKSADNSWKYAHLEVEVVAEAKQTTNNASDWSEVQKISYTAAEGYDMEVVVSETDLMHKIEYKHEDSKHIVCSMMEYGMVGSMGYSSGAVLDFDVIQLGVEKDFTMTVSDNLAPYLTVENDILTFKFLDAGAENIEITDGYITIECDGLSVDIPCDAYLFAQG